MEGEGGGELLGGMLRKWWIRTVLSEKQVARRGSVGCGTVCQARDAACVVRLERRVKEEAGGLGDGSDMVGEWWFGLYVYFGCVTCARVRFALPRGLMSWTNLSTSSAFFAQSTLLSLRYVIISDKLVFLQSQYTCVTGSGQESNLKLYAVIKLPRTI